MTEAIGKIPWQLVVAGGAAASGIVFAYKVGDGIQRKAAGATGDVQNGTQSNGGCDTAQLICAVCALFATGYLIWRIGYRRRPLPESQDAEDDRPSP